MVFIYKYKCEREEPLNIKGKNNRCQNVIPVRLINSAYCIRNGELVEMCMLEATEIQILTHLYDLGILDLNGGWEMISNLDEIAVERLYSSQLVDKSILSPAFIRLSALGVGTVLFGFQKADKIFELL
jgi:hypothetical protein